MPADNRNEDKFDEMLSAALRRHCEAVPVDFTERMLEQVRELHGNRVLAQVVLQERLALTASVVLGGLAILGAVFFPARIVAILRSIGEGLVGYGGGLAGKIPQAIDVFGLEWQFYTVLAVLLAFAVCCLMGLVFGDRVKMV
ncbi:MAG TPA: hypothetical protein VJJ98_01225 [Sedimentisphaerales bacterium]|nr:hypothetical protein [Sedimentisphaerales bacterium]